MAILQVICPECSSRGNIEISNNAIKNVSSGLLAVNVPQGTICSHSFITYVDKNLEIRDYFMADFQFELPDTAPTEEFKVDFSEEILTGLSLIKLNLSATLLTYILKSILMKKNILLISKESFMNPHILGFFKMITQDNFNFNISFISEEEFKYRSNEFKDFMIFEGNEIVNNVNQSLNPKTLKVEKKIVHIFISEVDLNSSLIMLKNELLKAYLLSNLIVDFIQKINNINNLNISKLCKNLEKSQKVKINNDYLLFLLDIVRNYFGFNIPSATESFFKLLS